MAYPVAEPSKLEGSESVKTTIIKSATENFETDIQAEVTVATFETPFSKTPLTCPCRQLVRACPGWCVRAGRRFPLGGVVFDGSAPI